jgi:hypothetical protein
MLVFVPYFCLRLQIPIMIIFLHCDSYVVLLFNFLSTIALLFHPYIFLFLCYQDTTPATLLLVLPSLSATLWRAYPRYLQRGLQIKSASY